MKQPIRLLTPLLACMMLSACGGKTNLAGAAYPQQYGQMGYSQPGMTMGQQPMLGQSAYTQPGMAQDPAMGMAQPMGQPMGAGAPMANPAGAATGYDHASAPQTSGRNSLIPGVNSRPTPSFNNLSKAPVAPTAGRAPKPSIIKPPAPKAAAPAPAAPAASAAEVMGKLRQAVTSLQSFQGTVSTFEKGERAGQGKINYYYRGGQVKIDVIASSDSSRVGVKLGFQAGGTQAKVRPTGILSMVAVNLSMSDAKLLSGRKYQIGQIDLIATANRLSQQAGAARVVGKSSYAGAEIIIVEITAPNPFDPAVTKEQLGLDAKTFLPRVHEMYVGSELVYAGRVENCTVNGPITDAMMTI